MINFPFRVFPYSYGINEITKLVPSLPKGSSSPVLGETENSGSDSCVKDAWNVENCFTRFVNLKDTLAV